VRKGREGLGRGGRKERVGKEGVGSREGEPGTSRCDLSKEATKNSARKNYSITRGGGEVLKRT